MSVDDAWQPMQGVMTLARSDAQVVRGSLDAPASAVCDMARVLSDDERERAGRFRFERDRQRFIVGRGMLRMLLSRYVGIGPERIVFRYGAQGKPELASALEGLAEAANATDALYFNVAHSDGLVLFAFARGRRIGVDVERLRPIREADAIAARRFAPQERAVLQRAAPERRLRVFLNCWTRKEAYLKASGAGLTLPLQEIVVTLAEDEPAKLLSVSGNTEEAARWSLRALTPAEDYVAALAIEGASESLSLFTWQWA